MSTHQNENIDWCVLLKAAAVIGWHAPQVYQMTLPELVFALDGVRRARGIPDKTHPMSKSRLLELVEQSK